MAFDLKNEWLQAACERIIERLHVLAFGAVAADVFLPDGVADIDHNIFTKAGE